MRTCILLIGCGMSKSNEPTVAKDMYTGGLFAMRLRYAEATVGRVYESQSVEGEKVHRKWWIISAKHGLVDPNTVIAPYDLHIKVLNPLDRIAWYLDVMQQLLSELPDRAITSNYTLEVHAGKDYSEMLCKVARVIGFMTREPVAGLGIGEQMKWYAMRD